MTKGKGTVNIYRLTAFEKNGEKILDESFEAADEAEAKEIGGKILKEKGALEKTHRCVTSKGQLLLFHP